MQYTVQYAFFQFAKSKKYHFSDRKQYYNLRFHYSLKFCYSIVLSRPELKREFLQSEFQQGLWLGMQLAPLREVLR